LFLSLMLRIKRHLILFPPSLYDGDMSEAIKARLAMRRGEWTEPTVYKIPGFVQANLVVLHRDLAYDFLVYCQRNPKACPVIEVCDPGDPVPRSCAPDADLRTDLARYRVYRKGEQQEDLLDITALWTEHSVAFLLGSSLSFDEALVRAGVERSEEVWAYDTNIATHPAGPFEGPLVVTMRLMAPDRVITATQLTGRYVYTHGAPVHIGDPAVLGIDLGRPLFGSVLKQIPAGKTAVFWACWVTPQRAAIASRCDLMITHSPGHGFVTDLRSDRFCLP